MFAIPCPCIFQWEGSIQDNVVKLPLGECYDLGKAFAERYKNRTNLLFWMAMAFDAVPGCMSALDVLATAQGIRAGDPNHLVSLGPKMHQPTTGYAPISDCHQLALYASYHKYTRSEIAGAMDAIAAKGVPIANMEGPAFGAPGIGIDKVTAAVAITKSWPVIGHFYIDDAVYPFRAGWQDQLNNAGVRAFLSAVRG
jgi:hypothetical protein